MEQPRHTARRWLGACRRANSNVYSPTCTPLRNTGIRCNPTNVSDILHELFITDIRIGCSPGSPAAIHDFEHQWHLHAGTITLATTSRGPNASSAKVKRIFTSSSTPEYANGLPVTSKARTVVDCGLSVDFRFALPIIDSALRNGVAITDILNVCSTMRRDCTPIFRLLHYANPASENGGESLGRGTIIAGGLLAPELQQNITDPQTGALYRVDFLWRLPENRLIVGEFDGYEKYVNPDMNDRKGVRGAVQAEKERETALYRAKVDTIVRFTYEEVMQQHPLLNKLRAAGIPHAGTVMGAG